MQSRVEYFTDLIEDCKEAVDQANLPPEQVSHALAALILSDSYNGLRKALLQAAATVSANQG